jgi:hypothetical protein
MAGMKKFSFSVDVVDTELDRDAVSAALTECLEGFLADTAHAAVKQGEVKNLSEQGHKVWRARVTGVTAEQAGDSANPKKSKREKAEADAETAQA